MSTTGSRWVGTPQLKTYGVLLGTPPKNRDAIVERGVKTFKTIGSPDFPFDEERIREVAGRSYDRGDSPAGVLRQLHAITASGDRTAALRRLDVPATVIHGSRIPSSALPAAAPPPARSPAPSLRMIEGMGHDLPRQLWPEFVEAIADNAARASSGAGEKSKQPA